MRHKNHHRVLKKTERNIKCRIIYPDTQKYKVITILVIKGQQVAQTFLDQTVLVFMIKIYSQVYNRHENINYLIVLYFIV